MREDYKTTDPFATTASKTNFNFSSSDDNQFLGSAKSFSENKNFQVYLTKRDDVWTLNIYDTGSSEKRFNTAISESNSYMLKCHNITSNSPGQMSFLLRALNVDPDREATGKYNNSVIVFIFRSVEIGENAPVD